MGFFAGREFFKWEIARAFSGVADAFAGSVGDGPGIGSTASKKPSPEVQQAIARIKVESARIYRRESDFMDHTVIEINVKNGNPHAISRVYFHGKLASPGRTVPWQEGAINYEIPGGLEPGEVGRWTLQPGMMSDWSDVDVPEGAELSLQVVDVDWPGKPAD